MDEQRAAEAEERSSEASKGAPHVQIPQCKPLSPGEVKHCTRFWMPPGSGLHVSSSGS